MPAEETCVAEPLPLYPPVAEHSIRNTLPTRLRLISTSEQKSEM
jgi:hypothetical protein